MKTKFKKTQYLNQKMQRKALQVEERISGLKNEVENQIIQIKNVKNLKKTYKRKMQGLWYTMKRPKSSNYSHR